MPGVTVTASRLDLLDPTPRSIGSSEPSDGDGRFEIQLTEELHGAVDLQLEAAIEGVGSWRQMHVEAPAELEADFTVPDDAVPSPAEYDDVDGRLRPILAALGLEGLRGDRAEYLVVKLGLTQAQLQRYVHAVEQSERIEALTRELAYALHLDDEALLAGDHRARLEREISRGTVGRTSRTDLRTLERGIHRSSDEGRLLLDRLGEEAALRVIDARLALSGLVEQPADDPREPEIPDRERARLERGQRLLSTLGQVDLALAADELLQQRGSIDEVSRQEWREFLADRVPPDRVEAIVEGLVEILREEEPVGGLLASWRQAAAWLNIEREDGGLWGRDELSGRSPNPLLPLLRRVGTLDEERGARVQEQLHRFGIGRAIAVDRSDRAVASALGLLEGRAPEARKPIPSESRLEALATILQPRSTRDRRMLGGHSHRRSARDVATADPRALASELASIESAIASTEPAPSAEAPEDASAGGQRHLAQAETLRNRARYVAFRTSAVALQASGALDVATPPLARSTLATVPASYPGAFAAPELVSANLQTLFGHQGGCACNECQSVYSPAAYLADLYHGLAGGKSGDVLQQRLDARRPDITDLELSCTNTHTAMPAIDLVLELLEERLPVGLGSIADPPRQTTRTAQELLLLPEHERSLPYVGLAVMSYPVTLPWDRWFHEARLFLDHMGLPLHAVWEHVVPVVDPPDAFTRRAAQLIEPYVVRAHLGLTQASWEVLTSPAHMRTMTHDDGETFEPGSSPTLSFLLRHVGLWSDRDQRDPGTDDVKLLRDILAQRYIQAGRSGTERIYFDLGADCDPDKAVVQGMTEDAIHRIYAFEHLRRILGWSPIDLGRAITGRLGANVAPSAELPDALLVMLSHAARLRQDNPATSVTEILGWWLPIETRAEMMRWSGPEYEGETRDPEVASLYGSVFLEPTLFRGGRPGGEPDPRIEKLRLSDDRRSLRTGLNDAVGSFADLLAAALRLDQDTFHALVRSEFGPNGASTRLTLDVVSRLHRACTFSGHLGLKIRDLLQIRQLAGQWIDPFKSDDTGATIRFCEEVALIRQLGARPSELLYALQHLDPELAELAEGDIRLQALEERITGAISELRRSLSTPPAVGEVPSEPNAIEAVARGLGVGSIERPLLGRLQGAANPGDVAVTLPFLSSAAHVEIHDALQATDPSEVLGVLARTLPTHHAVWVVVSELLAGFARLPVETTRELLDVGDVAGWDPGVNPVRAYLEWVQDGLPESAEPVLRRHLRRLEKASTLLRPLELSGAEVRLVQRHPEVFHGLALYALPVSATDSSVPYPQWSALARYVRLRQTLIVGGATPGDELVALMERFTAADAAADHVHVGQVRASLEDLDRMLGLPTGSALSASEALELWTNGRIRKGALGVPDGLAPVVELARAAHRIGQRASVLRTWASLPSAHTGQGGHQQVTLDAPFEPVVLDNPSMLSAGSWSTDLLSYKSTTLGQIRNALRAQVSDAHWVEVAKNLRDRMRIVQRDRLLDAASRLTTLVNRQWEPAFPTSEQMYDLLLMDPLVEPCVMTTRLKAATASVQLFVERCLMGLEGSDAQGTAEARFGETWSWMRRYRVWEAFTKVVLYAENWIEPELRDDKTPFFEEFEADLAQGDLSDAAIERAVKAYLRKVDEVGHLEIVAFVAEQRAEGEVLHVVGRTREQPRRHFYRQRAGSLWRPWEPIDLDIDSEVVLLRVLRGRLYLFWSAVTERILQLGQDDPNAPEGDRSNHRPLYTIRMSWSERLDGRWGPRKRPDSQVQLLCDWAYKDVPGGVESILEFDAEDSDNKIVISAHIIASGTAESALQKVVTARWNDAAIGRCVEETLGAFVTGKDNSTGEPVSIATILEPFISGQAEIARSHLRRGDEAAATSSLDDIVSTLALFWPLVNTARLRNIWSSLDLEFKRYHYLTLVAGSGLPDRLKGHRFEVGRLELKGYRLRPTASSTTGTLDDSTPVTGLQSVNLSPSTRSYTSWSSYYLNGEQAWPAFNRYHFDGSSKFVTKRIGWWIFSAPKNQHFWLTNSAYSITLEHPYSAHRFSFLDENYCYLVEKIANSNKFSAHTFFHPTITRYNELLNDVSTPRIRDRFDALWTFHNQVPWPEPQPFPYERNLDHDYLVDLQTEPQTVSFDLTHPFGAYNWEIFFHIPFSIAVRLSQRQEHERAQQWFHYIFNPLRRQALPEDAYEGASVEQRDAAGFWVTRALHEEALPPQVDHAAMELAAAEVASDPFQPHRIARFRRGTYQKAVVYRYLENLIGWGDHLFEQDTLESLNEAMLRYVLAAKILGPRPRILPPPMPPVAVRTSAANSGSPRPSLADLLPSPVELVQLDAAALYETTELANAIPHHTSADVQRYFLFQWWWEPSRTSPGAPPLSTNPVFCIPANDRLLFYWDAVGDRLFKIRTCRNLAGQVRSLPIYEPPIPPELLIRARAYGLDLEDVLTQLTASAPPYRFRSMLQRALTLAGDVQRVGSGLLAAMEKRDAEDLALLRNTQEREVLELGKARRRQQLREAEQGLKAAEQSLMLAEGRRDFYASRPLANTSERAQVKKLKIAHELNIAGQGVSLAGSAAYIVPNFLQSAVTGAMDIEYGGRQVGNAIEAMGRFLLMISSAFSHEANLHGIQASWERRMDDWRFQADQAKREIRQAQANALAAELRVTMAEHERDLHDRQIEQASDMRTFLTSKFTNRELYDWSVARLSALHFEAFRSALRMARMAEACFRLELDDQDATFIRGPHWDNLRAGLNAGDALMQDLRNMDEAWLVRHQRQLREVTRDLSLRALDPMALDRLRFQGGCTFELPEVLFDLDHPGNYARRIRSVAVSIPSVAGPHTTLGCTLQLDRSWTRHLPDPSVGALKEDRVEIQRSRVTLSHGRNDFGLHQASLDDERYLPFEHHGVVSRWKLSFDSDLPGFDRTTISDVVLHLRYTARHDDDLQTQVKGGLTARFNAAGAAAASSAEASGDTAVGRMGLRVDVKRDLHEKWHQLREDGSFTLELHPDMLPYLLRPLFKSVTGVAAVAVTQPGLGTQLVLASGWTLGNVSTASGPLTVYQMAPRTTDLSNPIQLTLPPSARSKIEELLFTLFFDIAAP